MRYGTNRALVSGSMALVRAAVGEAEDLRCRRLRRKMKSRVCSRQTTLVVVALMSGNAQLTSLHAGNAAAQHDVPKRVRILRSRVPIIRKKVPRTLLRALIFQNKGPGVRSSSSRVGSHDRRERLANLCCT